LLSGENAADPAVVRAVEYLLDSQDAFGTWHEDATTGTGFPQVFYLKYHLYRHSFPVSALARYRALTETRDPEWDGGRQAETSIVC
jgi:squalene-hopene/tetraprenyl-beta-curcumene cyclase